MANTLPIQIGLRIAAEVLGESSTAAKDDREKVGKDKASGAQDPQSFASLLQGSMARKVQPGAASTAAKGSAGAEGAQAADLLKGKAVQKIGAEMKQVREAGQTLPEGASKGLENLAKKTLAAGDGALSAAQTAAGSRPKAARGARSGSLAQAAAEVATAKDVVRQAKLRGLKGQEGEPAGSAATSKQAARKVKSQGKAGTEAQKAAARDAAAEEKGKVEAGGADRAKAEAAAAKVKEPERAETAAPAKTVSAAKAADAAEGNRAQAAPAAQAADGRKAPAPATPVRASLVLQQVIENAGAALRQGSGRVVITLHPPRLGSLDMDLVVRDNRVKMVMLADSREVKEILESKMAELKTSLQEQGFRIDRLEVAVQDQSEKGDSGFWREFRLAEQESASSGAGRGGEREDAGREVTRPSPRRFFGEDESRMISIFA